jgi:hypothetical protein
MAPAFIAGLSAVLVAVIAFLGQLFTSRTDRTIAHLEVDLREKLDADSDSALRENLDRVIEKRI